MRGFFIFKIKQMLLRMPLPPVGEAFSIKNQLEQRLRQSSALSFRQMCRLKTKRKIAANNAFYFLRPPRLAMILFLFRQK